MVPVSHHYDRCFVTIHNNVIYKYYCQHDNNNNNSNKFLVGHAAFSVQFLVDDDNGIPRTNCKVILFRRHRTIGPAHTHAVASTHCVARVGSSESKRSVVPPSNQTSAS